MKKRLQKDYQHLIINTTEVNHWKITVESDDDKKLVDIIFDGSLPKQKASGNKPMNMKDVIFIIFGGNLLDDVLKNGLV